MSDSTLPLTDLSPLLDKEIVARFDGGNVSSDGGLIVLREVERRTRLSARLPPAWTIHALPVASGIATLK